MKKRTNEECLLELELNDKEQARNLSEEAIGIFIKLGMKRQIRETQALLDQIAAQRKTKIRESDGGRLSN